MTRTASEPRNKKAQIARLRRRLEAAKPWCREPELINVLHGMLDLLGDMTNDDID